MNIRGKVALVTGGASGLGAATARMLAHNGARVVLLDIDVERGESLAWSLGESCLFHRTEVTSAADAVQAVDFALSRFGRVDISVQCAGIAPARRVVSKEGPMSLEDFTRVIMINLVGTFNILRLAAAAMGRNEPDAGGERGVIINTASVAAFDGQIGQAAYSASKAGVAGMTLPLARDLAKQGIRVMAIAPGVFDTPMMGGMPPEVRDSLGAAVPFPPRMGNPEEYAQLVRHIIENSYLNGEIIRLDGALRMAPK